MRVVVVRGKNAFVSYSQRTLKIAYRCMLTFSIIDVKDIFRKIDKNISGRNRLFDSPANVPRESDLLVPAE